jgi:HEPN domain-containing protein
MSETEKYKTQSIHYFENALVSIEAGDAEKAGEFLWGSMAQALKAVAASEGRELTKHWEIGDYARELAKKRGDKSIWDVYGNASYLHSNFYEAGLRMEEVYTYAERIRAMVSKLLNLIPEEGERRQKGK